MPWLERESSLSTVISLTSDECRFLRELKPERVDDGGDVRLLLFVGKGVIVPSSEKFGSESSVIKEGGGSCRERCWFLLAILTIE